MPVKVIEQFWSFNTNVLSFMCEKNFFLFIDEIEIDENVEEQKRKQKNELKSWLKKKNEKCKNENSLNG